MVHVLSHCRCSCTRMPLSGGLARPRRHVCRSRLELLQHSCWVCCGMLFFIGYTAGRAIFASERNTWKDFTLSVSCGCASGFFVGTDSRYPQNFLQPIVGERTGTDSFDVFKAGLSTCLGFLVSQLCLSLTVPDGLLWTDDDSGNPSKSKASDRESCLLE